MKKFNRSENSTDKSSIGKNDQAGYGVIIVILLIFFFFVMVLAGVASSVSSSRGQENLVTRQKEKWEAKSGLAVMRRVLQVRMPQLHQNQLAAAQTCLPTGSPMLKAFDEQDLSAEESTPVAFPQPDGTVVCNSTTGEYTSLLGNSNSWATTLLPLWEQEAFGFGFSANTIKVARLIEQVRTFNAEGEAVYHFGFIIDARGGQHYRVRDSGIVMLGNLTANCGATGILEINPTTVITGTPVTFRVTYTNVNRIRILNQAGVVLQDTVVVEQSAPQVYEWVYTPTATDSYRVEALSSTAGCFSRSAFIQVEVTAVPPPVCPVINSFKANPDTVNSGDTSTIAWDVSGASEVTLDGVIVLPNTSQDFTIIADRTFTLVARDAANICPQTAQVNVTVVAVPCPAPSVALFQVSPASANPGDPVTITWQIDNLVGGAVNITLPDSTVLNNVGSSGSVGATAPSSVGTYNYSISASNPCGTATSAVAQLQVVNGCVPPTINSFTANPGSVLLGGNQNVVFNWNVSGQIDSQSIDQGIGVVSGNTVTIAQPQTTTTYTISIVGCGQTRITSVTVTVSNVSPPRVITQSRELAQNGGVFSCMTGNDFRVANGFPPIPCTNWTVDLTVTVTEESTGTYLITASKISNADTSPDLRARGFAPEIGIFGAVNNVPCNAFISLFCYENRNLLGFWSPYNGGVSNFGGIVAVNYDGANTTATWRLTIIPAGAEKIVFRSAGGGIDQYRIYFGGYNFGPGDTQSAGEYNYDYVGNCCGTGDGFVIPFDIVP